MSREQAFNNELKKLQDFMVSQALVRGKSRLSILAMHMRLCWKGLLSRIFQHKKPVDSVSCDVLVVHPSHRHHEQGRRRALISQLRQRGLVVEEFVEDEHDLLRGRCFLKPGCKVPWTLRWPAAHASYLLEKYNTKVVLTERHSWFASSFIKWFREGEAPKIVHMAHSVPSDESKVYSYFNYDFYFVFGRSSLEYLNRLQGTFGSTQVAFAGPYFMEDQDGETSNGQMGSAGGERLLFLGSGPKYEETPEYLEMCRWVLVWLKKHPVAELIVKVHPRGTGAPWCEAADAGYKISFLPSSEPLDRAAGKFSVVLSGYTNAIIDTSRQAVPLVLLGDEQDYFSTGRFGVPRARTCEELELALDRLLADGIASGQRMSDFFSYHIEHAETPLTSLVDGIESVAQCRSIEGQVYWLGK